MSHSKYILTVLAISCLIFANLSDAFAHNGEKHNTDKQQVKLSAQGKRVVSLLENYVAAIQSKDLAEIEKYVVMNDGFSSLEGTFEDLGWASYRQHLSSELTAFSNITYKATNIKPYVKGQMAYATFDYTLHITLKNNTTEDKNHPLKMSGKATFILILVNKEWKIRHMHTVHTKDK